MHLTSAASGLTPAIPMALTAVWTTIVATPVFASQATTGSTARYAALSLPLWSHFCGSFDDLAATSFIHENDSIQFLYMKSTVDFSVHK